MNEQEKPSARLVNTAAALIIVLAGGYLLYLGKIVIVPLILAFILTVLLLPVVNFLSKRKVPRVLAIILAMLLPAAGFVGLLWYFSTHFWEIFSEIPIFQRLLLSEVQHWVNEWGEKLKLDPQKVNESISQAIEKGAYMATSAISSILVSTTTFLGLLGLVLIYVFLLLLIAPGLKRFALQRLQASNYENPTGLITELTGVILNYFKGLTFVTLILATLITLGLWIIGLPHALLFGVFAAFGSLIPYVGTTLGGVLPFVYALVFYDGFTKAILVFVVYQIVQVLEGNFITPKVVGSSVSINPLVAIIVLIIGGLFWGIVGMVLSIPLTALVKILMSTNASLKPYAALLGNDIGKIKEDSVEPPAEIL